MVSLFSLGPIGARHILALAAVPFTGALVRYRVDYRPKGGVALDDDDSVALGKGWVKSSYVEMLRRVHRLEGWAGLQKGIMPTLLTDVIIAFFTIMFTGYNSLSTTLGYRAASPDIYGQIYLALYLLVCLPFVATTYRAMITPYCLPLCDVPLSLRVLLSPAERRRPAIIYRTPGLFAAQALQLAVLLARGMLIPTIPRLGVLGAGWWVRLGAYGGIMLASTIVLTPLEVIATRLSVQRNYACEDADIGSQDIEGAGDVFTQYYTSEDVVHLMDERHPYRGLVDAGRRIVDEEGWRTLFRGWWITMALH